MSAPSAKHLYLTIVSYGQVNIEVWTALINSIKPVSDLGWSVTFNCRIGDSDLARARNALLAEFTARKECSHMLCLDADVFWAAGGLERLLSHDVDLVMGCYPQRAEGGGFPIRWLPDPNNKGLTAVDPATGKPRADGLIEIDGGPAGFLLLSRACALRMAEVYADRWYGDHSVTTGKAVSVFEFTTRDNTRYSEDYEFCRLWREAGGKVWLDPTLLLHHHGTKTYSGCIGDWLKSREAGGFVAANDETGAQGSVQDGGGVTPDLVVPDLVTHARKVAVAQKAIEAGSADAESIGARVHQMQDKLSGTTEGVHDALAALAAADEPTRERVRAAVAKVVAPASASQVTVPEHLHPVQFHGAHPPASLSLSLATRGRPDLLKWTIERTVPNLTRDSTTLLVSVDEDDSATLVAMVQWPVYDHVVFSVRRRPDTVAEKWNSVITEAPADVYMAMVDYAPIVSAGFDDVVLEAAAAFPDGIGVVCGDLANLSFPNGQAVTKRMAELMGDVIYPEYFPYWFVDHWLDDLAEMTGRHVHAGFKVDVARRPGTQEYREPGFWGAFYDGLRPERHRIAEAILAQSVTPEWAKDVLRRKWKRIDQRSTMINQSLWAGPQGNAADGGVRYQRIKARALAIISGQTDEAQEPRACAAS